MLLMWKCCQYQIQFPIGNWQHWNWQHLHTGNIKQDICSSHRGNGSYLAQRRRGAEEFLDKIYMIDRIKKGRENEAGFGRIA